MEGSWDGGGESHGSGGASNLSSKSHAPTAGSGTEPRKGASGPQGCGPLTSQTLTVGRRSPEAARFVRWGEDRPWLGTRRLRFPSFPQSLELHLRPWPRPLCLQQVDWHPGRLSLSPSSHRWHSAHSCDLFGSLLKRHLFKSPTPTT